MSRPPATTSVSTGATTSASAVVPNDRPELAQHRTARRTHHLRGVLRGRQQAAGAGEDLLRTNHVQDLRGRERDDGDSAGSHRPVSATRSSLLLDASDSAFSVAAIEDVVQAVSTQTAVTAN